MKQNQEPKNRKEFFAATGSLSRRELLQFLGYSTISSSAARWALPALSVGNLMGCSTGAKSPDSQALLSSKFSSKLGLAPSNQDQLLLAQGLEYRVMVKWNDVINTAGERFGTNCDFNAFIPIEGPDEGFLCVNHEYPCPVLQHELGEKDIRDGRILKITKEQVLAEQRSLGISILKTRQRRDLSEADGGHWYVVANSEHNRRIDGTTAIPFAGGVKVAGLKSAVGTVANCAGGVTPWGTYLSCEENYEQFWGDVDFVKGGERVFPANGWAFQWWKHLPYPPEHYGWVIEVDPKTGQAKKHTSMGRFAHESATVVPTEDGRCVVYSGDDANDRCLYKFISRDAYSLENGTLYVANLNDGVWVPLVWSESEILKKHFSSQLEVLIRAREAALLVGGTPLDRPEDVERDPTTGAIIVALTNNKHKGNFYGSLLKIEEHNVDPKSLKFTHSTLLLGGAQSHVACPDNMAFDKGGNLWFTTDVSGRDIEKGAYRGYGNNSLFVMPKAGPSAGMAIRIASAPVDAEFSGPWFAPDGKTLFLSVQHPGEESLPGNYTSHWPDGGAAKPLSAVVTIRGPLLEHLAAGKTI